VIFRRIRNVLRYGLGPQALERKRADKRRAKRERFESGTWNRDGMFAQRRYASYENYLAHQASKLDAIIDRLRETDAREFQEFRERFASCEALRGAKSVLCLGARLGTEVRALHSLGIFAVGVDLNPGPDNTTVLSGDFHALVFPDASVQAVYTNALDHVFELDRMIGEVQRVLQPGGCFVAEIDEGFEEGGLPGDFEAIHWEQAGALIERIAKVGHFEVEEVRPLGRIRRGLRRLVVFRKPR
jgi:SAM-dependent methyltransferase